MKEKKTMLMDVVLMRLSLIFLLVVYHAFCIYTGAWNKPFDGFPDIIAYDWFGMLTHGFQLQSMVFISGLLFGYTLSRHPERLSFNSCVKRKAKRVLLPCYLFGIAYWLIFRMQPDINIHQIGGGILQMLNGIGHLWFLPMIFWCFVITYVLEKKYLCKTWLIWFFIVCATYNVISFVPLGLGSVPSYYLYFYTGFMFSLKRIKLPKINLVYPLVLFIIAFVACMYVKYNYDATTTTEKITRFAIAGPVNIIISITGVYMLYRVANISYIQNKINDNQFLIKLSGYCYGVYIFQQFILKILYKKTQLAYVVDAYSLPWIATAITIILSLLLTHLTLKTRVGRFLIG